MCVLETGGPGLIPKRNDEDWRIVCYGYVYTEFSREAHIIHSQVMIEFITLIDRFKESKLCMPPYSVTAYVIRRSTL
jgi:hypothetical protein